MNPVPVSETVPGSVPGSVPEPEPAVDILIVGAGLVGSPLALALDAAGWRVALLDRLPASTRLPDDPLDQRCTALSQGTMQTLARLGLWPVLSADATPITVVHVSQRGHWGATRIRAAEEGVAALGHVVENRRFLAALEPALARSTVRRITEASVESVKSDPDTVTTGYRQEGQLKTLSAKLLIGADGVGSAVREALCIGVEQTDYEQVGVLGTLGLNTPPGLTPGTAFERFTAEGALALLPRQAGISSFVRCVCAETASRLMDLDDAGFVTDMQQVFGHRAGRFDRAGPHVQLPLMRIEAQRQIDQRAVLLGNAARLLHPVAGQGYNLAMRDVDALLAHLSGEPRGALAVGRQPVDDPGSARLLDAFAAERRHDQWRTVRLTDSLARGFRGSSAMLGHLRGAALVGLDAVAPLRHGFARLCMGL